MGYYSAIKKNKITPFAATWVDLKTLILSEVSQKENKIEKENDTSTPMFTAALFTIAKT